MLIQALVENTAISENYKSIHGLSLYIKTQNHKILFDLGPKNIFYDNAVKMNINMEDIDLVVISHGHNDHGGALKTFLEKNKKAKIYISESAFDDYYYKLFGIKFYIGLDQTLKTSDRFIFTKGSIKIDEELQLFSDISEHNCLPNADNSLLKKVDKKYEQDTFLHEQNLIIREGSNYTLVAGCAHNGIFNILEKAEQITGTAMKTVVSGFHLYHLPVKKRKNADYLKKLAEALKTKQTKYYTCHCTGKKQFEILHKEMEDQMNYISTGAVIEV